MTETPAIRDGKSLFAAFALTFGGFLCIAAAGFLPNWLGRVLLIITGVILMLKARPRIVREFRESARSDGDILALAEEPRRRICSLCHFPGVRESTDYCVFCGWAAEEIPSAEQQARHRARTYPEGSRQARLRALYQEADARDDDAYGVWMEIIALENELQHNRMRRHGRRR